MKLMITVDGRPAEWTGPSDRRLIDMLRDDLASTAPKLGCGIGRCGACAVLLDGQAVPACLVLAAQADGRSVTTADGLGEDGDLIRRALVDAGAVQCGYCTSGVAVALASALRETPRPATNEVLQSLNGQLCRCGGYEGLRRAVAVLFD